MVNFRQPIPQYQPPKPFVSFPCAKLAIHVHNKLYRISYIYRWLLQVYTHDVQSSFLPPRRPIYGCILKIDSTKKVVKKLQGVAAGTMTWVTNVDNEQEEVLISVVTESEGLLSLKSMTDGLVNG